MSRVTATAEILVDRTESIIAKLRNNRHKLYKLYAMGIIVNSIINFSSAFWMLSAVDFEIAAIMWTQSLTMMMFMTVFFVLVGGINLLMALGILAAVPKQNPRALDFAVLSLIVNLISGSLLLVFFGLYAFLNKPFRESAQSWAPDWYKNVAHELGEVLP